MSSQFLKNANFTLTLTRINPELNDKWRLEYSIEKSEIIPTDSQIPQESTIQNSETLIKIPASSDILKQIEKRASGQKWRTNGGGCFEQLKFDFKKWKPRRMIRRPRPRKIKFSLKEECYRYYYVQGQRQITRRNLLVASRNGTIIAACIFVE